MDIRTYLAAFAAAAMIQGCSIKNPEQPHIDILRTAAVLSEGHPDGTLLDKLLEHNLSGNYTAAIQLLEEKVEKDPKHIFFFIELGIAYFDRAEQARMLQIENTTVRSDLEKAEQYLEKARQMGYNDKRADSYLKRVNLEKALLK